MESASLTGSLKTAIKCSDLQEVAALIEAGADVHYQNEHGYDALLNAVYAEDDSRLLEMLNLLVQSGASLRGMSSYGESAVRVLSRRGRFDAVELLLKAGADPDDVNLTPLMEAVAFGTLADVKNIVEQGADLGSGPNGSDRVRCFHAYSACQMFALRQCQPCPQRSL